MDNSIAAEIELLTVEYIEEVVGAGGAKLMSSSDLADFISELVVNNFDEEDRAGIREFAKRTADMCLLPEECRKRGIEIDNETVKALKESLS